VHIDSARYGVVAMRFRTITETPLPPGDQVFRQSRIIMSLGAVILGVTLSAIGFFGIRSAPGLAWPFTAIASLFFLPFGYLAAVTYHSGNWIVRYRYPKLLIKFRSFMNCHLAKDDPAIIELDISDIVWIRKVRSTPSTQVSPLIFLDIKLRPQDLSGLKEQLAAEAQCRRLHFGHDPVMLLSDGILRIEWRGGGLVTPNIDKAIAMLQTVVPIGLPDEPHIQLRVHPTGEFTTQNPRAGQ